MSSHLKNANDQGLTVQPEPCATIIGQADLGMTLLDSVTKQVNGINCNKFLENISSLNLSGQRVVFDLDNTLLLGDIGDGVHSVISRHYQASRSLPPCHIDDKRVLYPKQSESAVDFYDRVIASAYGLKDEHEVTAAGYRWLSVYLAGLSIQEIENFTEAAWQERFSAGELGINPKIVEVLACLMVRGARPAVVSATNHTTVSWVVHNIINPVLRERGILNPISQDEIFGTNNLCTNALTVSDILLADGSLDSKLTERIDSPSPIFAGKAALVLQKISKKPFFVCGDSPNDFWMLALAENQGWVCRANNSDLSRQYVDRFKANCEIRSTPTCRVIL